MSTIQRHGLTFALIGDPDGPLWFEIRRIQDQVVVVSRPFDAEAAEFANQVDGWLDEFVRQCVDEMPLQVCDGCGGHQVAHDTDDDLTPQQLIEYRLDLCSNCARHLMTTNPWVCRVYGRPYSYD